MDWGFLCVILVRFIKTQTVTVPEPRSVFCQLDDSAPSPDVHLSADFLWWEEVHMG